MDKEPFVSGAYRREDEEKKPEKSISEIAQDAIKKKRFRKSFGQEDPRLTPGIKRATKRMLGEKETD